MDNSETEKNQSHAIGWSQHPRLFWLAATILALILATIFLVGTEKFLDKRAAIRFSAGGDWLDCPSGKIFYKALHSNKERYFVLESGQSGLTMDMLPLARQLAPYGHVIVYDRSGLGLSKTGLVRPNLAQVADDTKCVIEQLASSKPVIYVGYSMGGTYVINFMRTFPSRLAAAVLLDLTPQYEDPPPTIQARINQWLLENAQFSFNALGRKVIWSALGLSRLSFFARQTFGQRVDPELELLSSFSHIYVRSYEIQFLHEKFTNLVDYKSSVGDQPLLVITAKNYDDPVKEKKYGEYCMQLAKISSHGHYIHLPQLEHLKFKDDDKMEMKAQPIMDFLRKENLL